MPKETKRLIKKMSAGIVSCIIENFQGHEHKKHSFQAGVVKTWEHTYAFVSSRRNTPSLILLTVVKIHKSYSYKKKY